MGGDGWIALYGCQKVGVQGCLGICAIAISYVFYPYCDTPQSVIPSFLAPARWKTPRHDIKLDLFDL